MPLDLQVVAESLSPRRDHVTPGYEQDPGFEWSWWHSGSAKSPVSYCRFLDGGVEVARAKVLPGAGEYKGYTSWSCPWGGVTEIDLFEVRVNLHGRGYGTMAVNEIIRHYGAPVVAMSRDESSDGFWHSLGWTAHTHPDDDEDFSRYRTLFTSV